MSIQVGLTSDFPNGLPDGETLASAVQLYQGSVVLYSAACHSGIKSGWMIDVKRVFSADISVTTRHAFIPISGGTAEFIFSVDSTEFRNGGVRLAVF